MASQIIKPLPGKHEMDVDWKDVGKVKKEDEDDDIQDNGTDYVGKSFRVYSGLIQDADLAKAANEDAEEYLSKAQKEEEEDDDDEDEYEMGKSVKYSFFDFVEASPTLIKGINSSPFLYEMVKSIGLSFANMEDRLGKSLFAIDLDHDQFAKSLDGAFGSMQKSLNYINGISDEVDVSKSSENFDPASIEYLEKGGQAAEENLSKVQILDLLVKGVEEGVVPPSAVIKFEHTGLLNPELQKSLGL